MGVSLEEGKNIQLQMSHDEEIHSDKLYERYILQFYNCKVDLRTKCVAHPCAQPRPLALTRTYEY